MIFVLEDESPPFIDTKQVPVTFNLIRSSHKKLDFTDFEVGKVSIFPKTSYEDEILTEFGEIFIQSKIF